MRALLKTILIFLLFGLLTLLTQVGGVVYLLSRLTYGWTDRWARQTWQRPVYRLASFVVLYGVATFLLVPIIAKPLGRVPLPLVETAHLRPLNSWTCVLNRHYVRPALRQTTLEVARQMNEQFPGTTLSYLDANFPFIDRFPLWPHLSHHDGRKLDISFFYKDAATKKATNASPAWMGYGVCEDPLPGELDKPAQCAQQGYWQYSLLPAIVSQKRKKDFLFDSERTKVLVQLFARQRSIKKIFLEPHLKTRLNLSSSKVRFHGCRAVRHDDHLHVQL